LESGGGDRSGLLDWLRFEVLRDIFRRRRWLARDLQWVEHGRASCDFAARQPTLSAASALLDRGRRRGAFVGSRVDSDPSDVCSFKE
jgi:hypothetical protein